MPLAYSFDGSCCLAKWCLFDIVVYHIPSGNSCSLFNQLICFEYSAWSTFLMCLRSLVFSLLCMFWFPCAAGPKDTPMEVVMERTYDPKTGKGMPDL